MVKRIREIVASDGHYKTIGFLTMLNVLLAISAFIKDVLLASYLGTTAEADVFLLAFFIVDMIGNNLIGFSLGISAIPAFSAAIAKKNKRLVTGVLLLVHVSFLLMMGFLAILMVNSDHTILSFFSGGFSEHMSLVFVRVFRILLPTMLIYPLIAAGNAVLQASDIFSVGVVSSLSFNVVFFLAALILTILRVPAETGIIYISAALIFAAVFMFSLVYYALLKHKIIDVSEGFWLSDRKERLKEQMPYLKFVFQMFIPYFLMTFLTQVMLLIERYFASGFAEGSVSALNYAYRLSQIPVWIFVSAIGMAVFPVMARLGDQESKAEVVGLLMKSLKMMSVLTIPMMLGLFFLRYPIITILFKRGAFDETSVQYTCNIIAGYALGILGQSIVVLCLRYYLAVKQLRKPLSILVVSFALNVLIDVKFIGTIGLAGIGFGSAIANTACAGLFLWDIVTDNRKAIKNCQGE